MTATVHQIVTTLPIPDAALDDRLGIVGTAGSGKTYGAGTAVERLLARGSRVIIPDPLGVWFGLRLRADGSPSPFDVVIFGGPHGDLPINDHAGALIGETVAGMKESAIVDLSALGTKAAERRFMLNFLTALHRKASGEPVHLVFDEADLWAPQQIRDREQEPAKLLGMMETIVRRGRIKGFIPWLITQRPAVISKDVLSQVDGLIAFSLTASQDRKALGEWIDGQADREQGKAILASLPTLARGQAVVWVPRRGILATEQFPAKTTFDSSRTPSRGEKFAAAALKPLDVGSLRARLATVEAEVAANDPARLRKRIAELERATKSAPSGGPDPEAIATAERAGFERGELAGRKRAVSGIANLATEMAASAERAEKAIADIRRLLESFGTFVGAIGDEIAAAPQQPAKEPPRKKLAAPAQTAGAIDRPLQTIVDAIAWWNDLGVAEPSHPQVAFIAGYSHKSGTWATYLSRLRSMQLIEGRGALTLTIEGRRVARAPAEAPSGDKLRAIVLGKIDGPLSRILAPIINAYPDALSHADVAGATGYSAQSGTWATYLSRLRSLDLIEGRGALKAQGWLFP